MHTVLSHMQEHPEGQGLQLEPFTDPPAAYEAFSFKPMLSSASTSTEESVFCVSKHKLGDAPLSPSALSQQVPSMNAAVEIERPKVTQNCCRALR